jgi:outer membrane protein OmpA-like peptidoglycan-associated protein
MSIDLGNLLQSQLGGVLGQFLTNSGEAEESSGKATGLAIPAIVAGLVKHVSGNPTNASGLFDLITGAAGNSLTGAVSQAAEGSNLGSLIDLGKSLLPNLLGGNAADVADQISQQSGVSKASSGSLLSLALPLVLSVLRGQAKEGNLNQGQLLGLLAQQQGWLSQVLDSNMLSALGIGSLSGIFGGLNNLLSGLGNAGAAVAGGAAAATAAAKKGGNGKWIALAVAAVLALLAFKSCGNGEQAAAPAASEPAASAVSEALAEVASAPAAASEASAPAPVAADNARVVYENGVATFFFATGKNDVAEGAQTIVADVINAGKDGKKLVVSGFADSTGNAAANEELSKQRAQAVQAFFEAQGVNAANIELRKPENTTGAVGNDVEGRRVEVKVEG